MVLLAVHGSSSRSLPAERGTVRLALELEDDDRAAVVTRVTALHERFVGEAKALVGSGSATWWGSGQVSVRSEHRYEGRDETRRVVQVASAAVLVRFRDFEALATWVLGAGSEPGAAIHRIEWTVTAEQRTRVERELRVQAVQDAVERAETYASAIGGSGVELRTLWEAGLRPEARAAEYGWTAQAMSRGESAGIELRPEEIEIGAAVTADFAVTGLPS